ncbi:hypothetical protein EBS02_08895, partial [bacterium]|nr:hypothetical protein [bacterium]
AFQEAGVFTVTPVDKAIRLDFLGIFPSWESLAPQLILLIITSLIWLRQNAKRYGAEFKEPVQLESLKGKSP